ncbi:MAG: hypothetical protein H6858_09905 [Rhodospirillales bacterium]|nr:hypothetical protein [Alphaproteobacteria bacterium]MCB9977900.1 hypothetical protein [Rhodospirillales bacterium]
MAAFENDTQREGFNNAVGVVRFQAYPGSLYDLQDGPVQVFETRAVQSGFEQGMGMSPPPVAFQFMFTKDQLESLQRLDQGGLPGTGTSDLGIPMQILRNDENGITLTTVQDLPGGGKIAAEITFSTDDINQRLVYMNALQESAPGFDQEPHREQTPQSPLGQPT